MGRDSAGRRWDLSGPYRPVFDTMLPDAVKVADPSISSSWPTRSWMSAAARCQARRSAIGAARTTRCIGAIGHSRRPMSVSTITGDRSSSGLLEADDAFRRR